MFSVKYLKTTSSTLASLNSRTTGQLDQNTVTTRISYTTEYVQCSGNFVIRVNSHKMCTRYGRKQSTIMKTPLRWKHTGELQEQRRFETNMTNSMLLVVSSIEYLFLRVGNDHMTAAALGSIKDLLYNLLYIDSKTSLALA